MKLTKIEVEYKPAKLCKSCAHALTRTSCTKLSEPIDVSENYGCKLYTERKFQFDTEVGHLGTMS